jgi:hypothetical protein
MRNVYKLSVMKLQRKRPCWRPKHGWKDVNTYLGEIGKGKGKVVLMPFLSTTPWRHIGRVEE